MHMQQKTFSLFTERPFVDKRDFWVIKKNLKVSYKPIIGQEEVCKKGKQKSEAEFKLLARAYRAERQKMKQVSMCLAVLQSTLKVHHTRGIELVDWLMTPFVALLYCAHPPSRDLRILLYYWSFYTIGPCWLVTRWPGLWLAFVYKPAFCLSSGWIYFTTAVPNGSAWITYWMKFEFLFFCHCFQEAMDCYIPRAI